MCDGCKLGYGITLFLPKNYQLCMVTAVIFNNMYGFITVADTSRIIGGGGGGGGGHRLGARYANLSNMLGISNSLFNYCNVTITLYAYTLVCFLVPLAPKQCKL